MPRSSVLFDLWPSVTWGVDLKHTLDGLLLMHAGNVVVIIRARDQGFLPEWPLVQSSMPIEEKNQVNATGMTPSPKQLKRGHTTHNPHELLFLRRQCIRKSLTFNTASHIRQLLKQLCTAFSLPVWHLWDLWSFGGWRQQWLSTNDFIRTGHHCQWAELSVSYTLRVWLCLWAVKKLPES